jgi:LysM domain
MATPGEVNQEIGRAYQYVFIGALQASIPGFQNNFFVHTEPDKTSFTTRTGKQYSFDFSGVYSDPLVGREVLGECKGYSKAAGLLAEFRSFIAKAYVTSTDYTRHRNDYFWFVTNVPFACSEGSGIRNQEFIRATLEDRHNAEVKEILGDGHVDNNLVWSLAERIGVFILTDSFLMNTELSYKVEYGDSLWTILKKLYAGRAPGGFGSIARDIAYKNRLRSPDHLISGQRIRLSWRGIRAVSGGGFGGF